MGGVRKELRDWKDEPRTEPAKFIPRDKPQAINSDRLSVIKTASRFQIAEKHPYLEQRGIKQSVQKSDRFIGTVALDSRGNAIFPHYDRDGLTGFTIKNDSFTGFSKGGTKALWQSKQKEGDCRLVITESAIDAMSYHQLFGKKNTKTRYIATGGTISNYQLELIKTAMADLTRLGGEIAIATDNDEAGHLMANTIANIAPAKSKISRHVPKQGKDWNEFLQQERQKEITRQQRQKGRGMQL